MRKIEQAELPPPFDQMDGPAQQELLLRVKPAIARTIGPGTNFFVYLTGTAPGSAFVTGTNFSRLGNQIALLDCLLCWAMDGAKALAEARRPGPKLAVPSDQVVTL